MTTPPDGVLPDEMASSSPANTASKEHLTEATTQPHESGSPIDNPVARDDTLDPTPDMSRFSPDAAAGTATPTQYDRNDFDDEFATMELDVDLATQKPPNDEEIYVTMRRHQVAAAVMFVPDLDPHWRKGPVTQRPLNSAHVKELQRRMSHAVKRTELKDRLCVSMTAEEYDKCLDFTVEQYRRWSAEGRCKPTTKERLRQMFKDAITSVVPLDQLPMLLWPSSVLKTRPQLDVGQHRRAAFLNLFNKGGEHTHMSPENKNVIGWVVDIALMDQLDDKYYRLIRANRHDVYAPDSEGDIMINLSACWTEFCTIDTGSRKAGAGRDSRVDRFAEFAKQSLGYEISNHKRYYQLLSNDLWRQQAIEFIQYAHGRQVFKVHQFTLAAGQFLNEFWFGLFSSHFHYLRIAFDECAKWIKKDDLALLHKVGRPNENAALLRILFFPTKGDPTTGVFAYDPHWESKAEFRGCKMQVPHRVNRFSYDRRRPDFLADLTHEMYCKTFDRIVQLERPVPAPTALQDEITHVGTYLTCLVEHVIFWANPYFLPPANNQVDKRAALSYVEELKKAYGPKKNTADDEGGYFDSATAADERIRAQKEANRALEKKVLIFLSGAQKLIHTDHKEWASVAAKKLSVPSHWWGDDISREERLAYRARFENPPWSAFLTLTIKKLGTDHFDGVMKPWKRSPDRHNTKSSLAPIFDQAHRWYSRVSSTRLRGINQTSVNSAYDHATRVSHAIERAVLAEEARTVAAILQDINKLEARMDRHFRSKHRRITAEELSEDEDGSRGGHALLLGYNIPQLKQKVERRLGDIADQLADYDISVADAEAKAVLAKLGKPPFPSRRREEEDSEYEAPDLATPARTPRHSKKRNRSSTVAGLGSPVTRSGQDVQRGGGGDDEDDDDMPPPVPKRLRLTQRGEASASPDVEAGTGSTHPPAAKKAKKGKTSKAGTAAAGNSSRPSTRSKA